MLGPDEEIFSLENGNLNGCLFGEETMFVSSLDSSSFFSLSLLFIFIVESHDDSSPPIVPLGQHTKDDVK